MKGDDLREALDGLFAYDSGAVDSGIHDNLLKQKVFDFLKNLDEDARRILLSRHVRQTFLVEAALEQGYGVEDVAAFFNWLSENGVEV